MKRLTLILAALIVLATAGVASGKIVQLGDGEPFLPASKCPNDPCLAAYQVTGYQDSADNKKKRFLIRRSGKVVAFTVKLGKLSANQVETFDQQFGAPASVRLTILRRGKKRSRRNDHRVLAQSEVFEVNDYFGESPTFVLDKPLNVPLGSVVALTVPTWAPVLAGDQGRSDGLAQLPREEPLWRGPPAGAPLGPAAGGPARHLGLQLQRRAAALHGHLRAGQPHLQARVARAIGELPLLAAGRARGSIGL